MPPRPKRESCMTDAEVTQSGFTLPFKPSRRRKNQRKISVSTRLTLPSTRKIDIARSELQLSRFAIPKIVKNRFPKLEDHLLETKFPHLTEAGDDLYYSRGRLGQEFMKEHFCNLKYTIDDEYNQRRLPKLNSYDPLHDHNLAHYIQRPVIKQHLIDQGFLRDDDNVVCSLKHFNEFRKCLGAVEIEQINELFRKEYVLDLERQQKTKDLRALINWKNEPKQRSGDGARARKKLWEASVRERLLDSFKRHEIRRKQADRIKHEIREQIQGCSVCRANMRTIAHDKAKLPNIEERRNIMMHILRREQATELRLATDKIAIRKFKTLKDLHRIQGKINAQIHDKGLMGIVQDAFEMRARTRAQRLGKQMEEKWKQLPIIIASRKAEEKRILALQAKYFYRWLYKVRQRRQNRQMLGTSHVSHWNVTDTMEKVNDNLCEDRVKIVDMKHLLAAAKRQIAIEDEAAHEKEEENRAIFKESLKKVASMTKIDEEGFQPSTEKKKKKRGVHLAKPTEMSGNESDRGS